MTDMFLKLNIVAGKIETEEPEPIRFRDIPIGANGAREADLEEFVRQDVSILFPEEDEDAGSLLIISQQTRNVSRGRSDLIAIDDTGALVLIELKRDAEDAANRAEAFEFQAVRYAANLATLKTRDELLSLFERYVARTEPSLSDPAEVARRRLSDFTRENRITDQRLNCAQRIILVAASFDDETLSAVAWMARSGLQISAIQFQPYRLAEQLFIEVRRVLPPPTYDEYFVQLSDPTEMRTPTRSAHAPTRELRNDSGRAYRPRISALMESGLLASGTKLSVLGKPDVEATLKDANTVDFRGKTIRINDWAQQVTGWSAVNIYDWVTVKESGKKLNDLRRHLEERQTAAP